MREGNGKEESELYLGLMQPQLSVRNCVRKYSESIVRWSTLPPPTMRTKRAVLRHAAAVSLISLSVYVCLSVVVCVRLYLAISLHNKQGRKS
jgi:hypothetical protein